MRLSAILALVVAFAQLPYARQAIDLAHTRDQALFDSFAKGYELAGSEYVDKAEVITEFRRAVMISREQLQRGQAGFSPVDLQREMKPYEGQVSFVVQARLHPMHNYLTPPAYEMFVSTGEGTPPLIAKAFGRTPVWASGAPASTLVGVRLEGTFSRDEIKAAGKPMLVVTDDKANIIWQTRLDLSRYR